MSSTRNQIPEKERVYLDSDDEIRGQKFVCLSFVTPERTIYRAKEPFMISKFLDFFALDYKVKASESFLFGELRKMQDVLSEVELSIANAALAHSAKTTTDSSGEDPTDLLSSLEGKIREIREQLAQKVPADLEAHIKENLSDFKESKIKEVWDAYMLEHRSKLEDEFHVANGGKTTMLGLKVRGSYPTHDQASARAKALNKKDPYHDIFVGEVGEWMPWDPYPNEIEDQEYPLDKLNSLMKGHREQKDKLDAYYEEEKRQKMAAAAAAAATTKKEATFGAKSEQISAAEVAKEVFVDVGEADLAIARKAAAATTTVTDASSSVISM